MDALIGLPSDCCTAEEPRNTSVPEPNGLLEKPNLHDLISRTAVPLQKHLAVRGSSDLNRRRIHTYITPQNKLAGDPVAEATLPSCRRTKDQAQKTRGERGHLSP